MVVVALSSFFIHTIRMWGLWSPIHLLSIATLASLAYAVAAIRRRNIAAHSGAMRTTYVGALVIAGFFTLAPGRIMNHVLFGAPETAPAAAPIAPHGPVGIMGIVTGTPLWVWPLLAYLLYVGWRRTHDRAVAPVKLFIMPTVITGLALYNLLASGLSAAALATFVAGAVLGIVAGRAVGRRRTATWNGDGLLLIRGDWIPLVLTLAVFALRYASGVTKAIDPVLASSPVFVAAGAFASGLFAALFLARTVAQLPRGFVRLPVLRIAG
jgi:hypothetical protein